MDPVKVAVPVKSLVVLGLESPLEMVPALGLTTAAALARILLSKSRLAMTLVFSRMDSRVTARYIYLHVWELATRPPRSFPFNKLVILQAVLPLASLLSCRGERDSLL